MSPNDRARPKKYRDSCTYLSIHYKYVTALPLIYYTLQHWYEMNLVKRFKISAYELTATETMEYDIQSPLILILKRYLT